MGLFNDRGNSVPVWFMRQAGRYHDHYQNLKKTYDFMTLCKNPKLAFEVTMGPMREFGFDAAILFSDLLFPLEQMGMGLSYASGPPTLKYSIETKEDFEKINITEPASTFYQFQNKALELLKNELPKEKSLLGFVGAPFTLFAYAADGTHSGNLRGPKNGLYDGRYERFLEILRPNLLENMYIQAEHAEGVCLFDTAVGELSLFDFKKFILPSIKSITAEFKKKHPRTKVLYYSKLTHINYLREIEDDNIDVLAIDWRCDLRECIDVLGKDYYIQGNIDPTWLFLPWDQLESNLSDFYNAVKGADLSRWICNLGHGVLPQTPQVNVKKTIEYIHSHFKVS